MTTKTEPAAQPGVEVLIPLNKLKKSAENARKIPHSQADIEALAASIAHTDLLQNLVVYPEAKTDGTPTGCYLVAAGEGRRLALELRAKRREIKRTDAVRCIVRTKDEALEVSLDENVTRTDMHPADQFEAFRALNEERGWGAEEIAARFGISPVTVRQRLRLGAISPRLMQLYRDGDLTLDQLIAFAVSDDHARQEEVYENLGWNKEPRVIRARMMEAHVPPNDPRAILVGVQAYEAAGGVVVRDLFSEEGGGYFEDAGLLDRLALERLNAIADDVRGEGWKWVEAQLDFPYSHGLRREYARQVPLSKADQKRYEALRREWDDIAEQYEGDEDVPDEVETRFNEIEAAIEQFNERQRVFDPDVIARCGVFVSLDREGDAQIDRGFVRAEDIPQAKPDRRPRDEDAEIHDAREDMDDSDERRADDDEEEADGLGRPLSDALVRDLTAHRTLALRLVLGEQPAMALIAITHALAAQTFYHATDDSSCLEVRMTASPLTHHAEGIGETAGAKALEERHRAWAERVPRNSDELWDFVSALGDEERMRLLAHCVSGTVNAVQQRWDTKRRSLALADALADAMSLDMAAYWQPTVDGYLGRVTKAHIAQAVQEGVSHEAAERITGLKKQPMAKAAEDLLAGTGWLPSLLGPMASHRDSGIDRAA
ncbi:MAG: ParB/RepB/Spo0J family partition protein [Dehalococcoidia bacterium]|nr:MAG: ParB/RepB/Spo0J family partition protein [Dehalococcoidia bacterium]